MSIPVSNFAYIALQFETATAQLRNLSAYSEAQRDSSLKVAMGELKTTMIEMEQKMKAVEIQHECAPQKDGDYISSLVILHIDHRHSLTDSSLYNHRMQLCNQFKLWADSPLLAFRSLETGEIIPNFPKSAQAMCCIDGML